MTRLLLALASALCLYIPTLSAQVVINEVSAANLNGTLDSDGDHEDWLELYNSGAVNINLSGWFLSDDPTNLQKWVIPNGQNIAPGAYRLVFCSGKNKVGGGNLHTNFKITQTKGESVLLTQPNGTVVDGYTFTTPNQLDHSYGRSPNGGASWKIFTAPTPGVSNTGSSYQSYAPSVQASKNAGFYAGTTSVSLSTTAGFTIRYTTNGSEPTAASTLYAAPVNIATTTVLKARAFSADPQMLPGFVTANTYFINVNHTVPVVSIAGDNVAALMGGSYINPTGSFEYFENNTLKDEAYGEFNKHGNDSWAYNQRGIDWITRDQMGYKDELKNKFFPERDRKKFQRLILKAAANDNYPASGGGANIRDAFVHTLSLRGGLDLDVRTSRSCVMYVNGQYWGIYDLREKADDADYTKYYYDQDEFDIDYIKTWGSTWEEYGSWTDWYTLKNYILGNNMATPANYAYVQTQFDVLSLIDYIIINQESVCKDWLVWNTSWWRGRNPNGTATRWRYALWDMDATFGHYINYTGIPNEGPNADPCDVEQIADNNDPQNHIDIFTALYNNPDFKALYINRYADLLNTSLSCPSMNALLDSMINVIKPEMAQHCARWGGTVNQWNQNVQALHQFINSRCQSLDQSIVDCYDVTGPFQLTVKVSPAASPNQAMVNTFTPTAYPFVGDYFGGVKIDLIAQAAPGWQFDHWEVSGNTFAPDQYAAAVALDFETSGMATAFFVPIGPCTEPTGLAISSTSPTTLTWTDQQAAGSYLIRYRKVTNPTWLEVTTTGNTWNFDTLPGCRNYEMQIQSVCPQGSSAFVDYAFSTPNHLLGVKVADVVTCNSPTALLDATVAGANYQWDNGSSAATRAVTGSGNYWVKIELNGCTLTDTASVSLINATTAIQPALCPGETFLLGSQTFDAQHASGQVILPGMATSGCDSIVNVSLQFLVPTQQQIAQKSCDPASVGVDTLVLSNVAGCDSLVITTTTLAPFSQTLLSAASCNPNLVGTDTLLLINQFGCDSLVITTTAFDAAAVAITPLFVQNCNPASVGVDTVFLSSVAGCDSLVITTTSLAPFSQTLLAAASCNPNLVGTDTLTLINQFGCDSLVITTTAFDAAAIPVTSLFVQNCNPASVGVDTVLLNSVAGCDSLVITTTSLAPFSQTLLAAASCNPTLVGTDTLTLVNQFGCDSLVITTTAFDAAAIPITSLFVQNCNPASVGVDTLILNSFSGCDSLVITTTTLAPFSQIFLTAASCNPTLVGTDTLTLVNQFGCDSLVITTTSFDAAAIPITSLFVQNCDPASVGVDTVLLNSVGGCDSLVITTTSLAPMSQVFLTLSSCNPNSVGIDTLILANQFGCDSLVITATLFDPGAISITSLFVQNCDPAAIGVDTLLLNSVAGCDSLVITTTTLAPMSQTFLTATSCDPSLIGTDTLSLANQFGCDSLVITTVEFTGLDFEASVQNVLCFKGNDGWIEIDTVLSPLLPVELVLDNHPAQSYTGEPLIWENLSAGIYSLLATNSAGCTQTKEVEIAEADALHLDFGQQPLALHVGDSIWVEPTADFQIVTAEWLPKEDVQCPICPATFIAPQKTGKYTLTASDANGCSTSASVTMQVEQGVRVYVPNAIHLGSSGPNGNLTIFTGPEVVRIWALQVFDRWGNQLFEQKDLTPNTPTTWAGRVNGKLINPGVLIWVCKVETKDGQLMDMSGDITVLR